MLCTLRPGRLIRAFQNESLHSLAGDFFGGHSKPASNVSCPSCPSCSSARSSFQPQCVVSMTGNDAVIPEMGGLRCSSSAVLESSVYDVGKATNIKWHESKVRKEGRQQLMNQKGCVIWMTGLSGSGKSTLAYTLDHALTSMGKTSYVLDGDNVRHGLNKNLGFSAEDREENIRRVSEVAKLFCEANLITLVSFISPYLKDRQRARELIGPGDFIEVYMKIPLSVCEKRDPKGLYKLARAGKIKGFTGIDDPYEEPEAAEIVMEVAKEDGNLVSPEVMAENMIKYLDSKGYLCGEQTFQ